MKLKDFKKLSKEKRKELATVLLMTAIVLGGLIFGLIKYQYKVLAGLEEEKKKANGRLESMETMARRAEVTKFELERSSRELATIEERMAPPDVYSWFISTLRPFTEAHKVEFQQYHTSSQGSVNLLPDFPYKQASLAIEGTARYYDLGTYLADLENEFPHVRVVNLDIQPASGTSANNMLSFKLDIVTLIRPNPS